MRVTKLLLLAPLALLVTACVTQRADRGNLPEPPLPLIDDATLLAAVDRTPHPPPPLRDAALGESGILTGPISPQFPVGQTVSLQKGHDSYGSPWQPFLMADVGRIVARGQVELRLPHDPDLAALPMEGEDLKALDFIRTFDSFKLCAVDTLHTAPGQEDVRLTGVRAVTRNPYVQAAPSGSGDRMVGPAGLRFATSPPPPFVNVLPYKLVSTQHVSEELGQLVYADGDVRLEGEMRCVTGWVTRLEYATQYNLFVNLDLRRGWNVMRWRLDGSVPRGTLEIVDKTLTGGAADYTFRPDSQDSGQDSGHLPENAAAPSPR